MNKQPVSQRRIRFKDCDPHGHLFNTRFIEYMLEAREDQILEEYNMSLMDYTSERNLAWVIVKHEIVFLKECLRNEIVNIRTQLVELRPKQIKVEYQMWSPDMSSLKCLLWTNFLHVELSTKKTKEHPQDMQDLLESLLLPLTSQNINDRAAELQFV